MDFKGTVDHLIAPNTNRSAESTEKRQSIEKTAQDFESFLIYTVLKEFGKTTQFTKKSYAEETQMSLFYEKVADYMAEKGIGIKEVLAKYCQRAANVPAENGENR